jgi:branched-chain amino acid transport system ATP-binding protein
MGTFQTEALSVSYGGVLAVTGVSLRVESGSAVGLIGPNGAGKTSFLDGITGLTQASGRVLLRDQDISGAPAHERARLGLRRTWQSVQLFDDLTVGENLRVSSRPPERKPGLAGLLGTRDSAWHKRAVDVLGMFGLAQYTGAMPQTLPLGVQKLIGVARALVPGPAVLGLDEPAAGLDRKESREFGTHLRTVVDHGVAVLLIDHDMELVLSVCDYIYVLDFGAVIAEGTPAEITADEKVTAAYLGGEVLEEIAPDPHADATSAQAMAGE